MSLHDPISRKRVLETDEISNKKRNTMTDDQFSEQMYSAYVKSALMSLEKDDPLQINTITDKINLPIGNPEAVTLSHLSIVLKVLASNTSRLDNQPCHNMIFAILRYRWMDHKDHEGYSMFVEIYSHFLIALVSTLPKYLHEVTNKLIGEFYSSELIHHHNILQKIMKYIPTSINTIPQLLQKNFPHHISSSTSELTNYVNNLVTIVSYCPELQFSIWQLIFECSIKLDVELQNELDDLEDEEIEELINGKEDDEELLEESSSDSEEEDDEDSEDEDNNGDGDDNDDDDDDDDNEGEIEWVVNSTTSIKALSAKLDSIISLLLTSTNNSFTVDELNNGNGVNLFNTINSLFKSHVLPTHFTKSIQFVLFHITQYQPELADSYLVLLIDVAFNPSEILEKRLKAMQYLSSYIARAKNLSRHQVVFIVSYLVGWLNKFILEREQEVDTNSNKQTGGMERFKLFYVAFQALLYIFCFRHESLTTPEQNWECDLDKFFQRAILTKFNPLKFCDETVVYIFAKIATKLNVCYCYSIIEHNKRERMLQTNGSATLPSAVGNFKQKQEFLDLEGYFPFDPLVLPNSKKIVCENYIEWSEVNPEVDDDDEDSASHGSDEDM
ncbi:RRN3 RNA polymerase I-specific transcription initiation factor RRN3 [Candida maltosa Xu316]